MSAASRESDISRVLSRSGAHTGRGSVCVWGDERRGGEEEKERRREERRGERRRRRRRIKIERGGWVGE